MKLFVYGTLMLSLLTGPVLVQQAKTQQAKTADTDIHLIGSIQGPALFQAYCAVCHGNDGRGNGPMAKALKVPPPDLTRIAVHNGGNFPMEQIRQTISGEVTPSFSHGTREMPVWGPAFSRVEGDRDWGLVRIDNLAKYLQSIQAGSKTK